MGKRYKTKEIVMKLREIELSISRGYFKVRSAMQTGLFLLCVAVKTG